MSEKKITLSKKDRRSVMLRSQFLQGSWNYERMQNGGWAYSLIPALKKLYPNKEDATAALKRHLEFFNTHPYIAAPILGVTLALEEDKANGADIDDSAIQGVKVGMMGPLAGIGDPVFWYTVRPILGAIAAPLATGGSIIAPLFFFIAWNAIRIGFLWYTQELGYKKGAEITSDLSGGILQKITKGASILGMFVMGILVQRWTNISFPMVINLMATKEVWPFFFLGFALAPLKELTLIATGIIGLVIAIVYLNLSDNNKGGGSGNSSSGDPLGDILNNY